MSRAPPRPRAAGSPGRGTLPPGLIPGPRRPVTLPVQHRTPSCAALREPAPSPAKRPHGQRRPCPARFGPAPPRSRAPRPFPCIPRRPRWHRCPCPAPLALDLRSEGPTMTPPEGRIPGPRGGPRDGDVPAVPRTPGTCAQRSHSRLTPGPVPSPASQPRGQRRHRPAVQARDLRSAGLLRCPTVRPCRQPPCGSPGAASPRSARPPKGPALSPEAQSPARGRRRSSGGRPGQRRRQMPRPGSGARPPLRAKGFAGWRFAA